MDDSPPQEALHEERDVFVLSCDINEFTKLDDAIMVPTVKVIFDVMENALRKAKADHPNSDVFHTFGGDGFLLVIAPDPAAGYRSMVRPFILLATDIHISIRSAFEKIKKELSGPNATGPSLRMGLNFGSAIYLLREDNTRLPVGPTLNDAQRIMDSARDWHILLSEDLARKVASAPLASKRAPLTGTTFKEFHFDQGGFRFRLTECPGWFTDKLGKPHALWWMYGEDEQQKELGVKTSPSKGPRHVRDRLDKQKVLDPIKSIIKDCTEFFSVTMMPPSIWLTDPTLTAVLLTQARPPKSNGKKQRHHRLFVWDLPLPHKNQRDLLGDLHEIAGVEITTFSREKLVPIVEAFQRNAARITGDLSAQANEFIAYPLREFWIATKGTQITSAGYGVDKDFDGSYEGVAELKSPTDKLIADCWKEALKSGIAALDKSAQSGGIH